MPRGTRGNGILIHALRRSAIRNMVAAVNERDWCKIDEIPPTAKREPLVSASKQKAGA